MQINIILACIKWRLHPHRVKPSYGGVLKQPQNARNHRADGLHGGGEDSGGGGEHGADDAFERKLNADGAWNNGQAKNEARQKWDGYVEWAGGVGGGLAGGGGAAEYIGAVQLNRRAADALAGAVTGGCAAELAADGEAVQRDARALGGGARGGGEEESGEEKGGGVVVGHFSSFI